MADILRNELIASGIEAARDFGAPLPEGVGKRFALYYRLLVARNASVNLTALTEERDVLEKHFLDSLALFKAVELKDKRLIDVGTGAGFPGVPVKLAEPSLRLTLLDSLNKRVDFLRELCGQLDIEAQCLHGRAEEAGLQKELRERFDVAVSRAVARLNVLCEFCLPFVKVGGVFVAMKTPGDGSELSEARRAIALLGGELEKTVDYEIAGAPRTLIVVRKRQRTPAQYPRRYAKLQKEPL